jgi:hypothetical protein
VPCIEIYALTASATKQVTSMRGLAETDSREDDDAAKIDLAYSTTRDISRARPTFRTLVVCIIQVTFSQKEFEESLKSDTLVFHCNTCDTDWPPSSEEIAKLRKQFSKHTG